MGTSRFTPDFIEEAVKQATERRYSVAEFAARIGVSAHGTAGRFEPLVHDQFDFDTVMSRISGAYRPDRE